MPLSLYLNLHIKDVQKREWLEKAKKMDKDNDFVTVSLMVRVYVVLVVQLVRTFNLTAWNL